MARVVLISGNFGLILILKLLSWSNNVWKTLLRDICFKRGIIGWVFYIRTNLQLKFNGSPINYPMT